jgi:hypothetical protein
MVNRFVAIIEGKVVATRTSQNRNYACCIVVKGAPQWAYNTLAQYQKELAAAQAQGSCAADKVAQIQKWIANQEQYIENRNNNWGELGWASFFQDGLARAGREGKGFPQVKVVASTVVPKGVKMPKVGDDAPAILTGAQ